MFLAIVGDRLLRTPASAAPQSYETVRMFAVDYVDVRDFGARFGLTRSWTVPQKQVLLKRGATEIALTLDAVEASLNGVRVFLSEPIVLRQGQLFLSRGDADNLFAPILAPRTVGVPRLKIIAVDAGHGGSDPGNQNRALKLDEKVFTLDVARRLQRLLAGHGYRVTMTRSSDRAVELDDRPAIANRARADLFVSIHFNAFSNRSVAGAETYVMTPQHQRSSPQAERDQSMVRTRYPSNSHDPWSALLGYCMQDALNTRLKAPDRGLKRFRYSVLRAVDCPAVLVEAAFLSNSGEARKVSTAAYRQAIAEAILGGITQYGATLNRLREKRRSSG